VRVTLLGHASVLVELDGATCLMDPVLADPFEEGTADPHPVGGLPHSRRAADARVALSRLLASPPAGRGSLGCRLLARSGPLAGGGLLASSGLLGHGTP
jgi:hypothetical protein